MARHLLRESLDLDISCGGCGGLLALSLPECPKATIVWVFETQFATIYQQSPVNSQQRFAMRRSLGFLSAHACDNMAHRKMQW